MTELPTLIWSESAIQDLETITGYIALDNWFAAIALQDKIETKAMALPNNPRACRIGRLAGTREMVVHPNYLIIYRENRDVVEVLRILHAAQRWP